MISVVAVVMVIVTLWHAIGQGTYCPVWLTLVTDCSVTVTVTVTVVQLGLLCCTSICVKLLYCSVCHVHNGSVCFVVMVTD